MLLADKTNELAKDLESLEKLNLEYLHRKENRTAHLRYGKHQNTQNALVWSRNEIERGNTASQSTVTRKRQDCQSGHSDVKQARLPVRAQ